MNEFLDSDSRLLSVAEERPEPFSRGAFWFFAAVDLICVAAIIWGLQRALR